MGVAYHDHQLRAMATLLGRQGKNLAVRQFLDGYLTRRADGLRLRDIPRAVPLTHPMFRAHALHINRDRYK
jgi:hypothetical protein